MGSGGHITFTSPVYITCITPPVSGMCLQRELEETVHRMELENIWLDMTLQHSVCVCVGMMSSQGRYLSHYLYFAYMYYLYYFTCKWHVSAERVGGDSSSYGAGEHTA